MRNPAAVSASLAFLVGVLLTCGCGIVGPSCLDRQKRGNAASLAGDLEPGQMATHVVPYDLQGSQNDLNITWTGQGTLEGPRLRMFVTSSSCSEFVPPALNDRGDIAAGACTILSRCGGSLARDARPCARDNTCQPLESEIICRSLIITGPGNGAPADFRDYKLHVVGDLKQSAAYSISVTWFFGPDC